MGGRLVGTTHFGEKNISRECLNIPNRKSILNSVDILWCFLLLRVKVTVRVRFRFRFRVRL